LAVRPAGILPADENFPTSREARAPIRALNLEQKTTKTAKIILRPTKHTKQSKIQSPVLLLSSF
jgi:hypothetical protein